MKASNEVEKAKTPVTSAVPGRPMRLKASIL